MEASKLSYLERMGIEVWVRRAAAGGGAPGEHGRADAADDEARWQALKRAVAACERCELSRTRTQTVFGVGNERADWMFVGEAPGAEEDRQGQPFVGRAGQLLNAMLEAVGLGREEVYIANVLKCRPPNNRDPLGEEVRQCEGYLHRQVERVRPKLIVALGRFAAQSLLKTTRPIGSLRGSVHRYADTAIPLVVTYHPAYLLRNPVDKREAWRDMCLARTVRERQPS
jgi:DNA polymerase